MLNKSDTTLLPIHLFKIRGYETVLLNTNRLINKWKINYYYKKYAIFLSTATKKEKSELGKKKV